MKFDKRLKNIYFEKNMEIKNNLSLKEYTTWGIGGEAEFLVEAKTKEEILQAVEWAKKKNLAVTILGKGSNVLIPDKGLKGLLIINQSKNIQFLGETKTLDKKKFVEANYKTHGEKFYKIDDLKISENGKKSLVNFDSGVNLAIAIQKTLQNNLVGLQWFAGIPSTVGGALYNNIHGADKHFSDYFYSAEVLHIESGKVEEKFEDFFEFAYDHSILKKEKDLIVLSVTLQLFLSDDEATEKAKNIAQEWIKRKSLQPRKTAGCIFKNLREDDAKRLNFPTSSAGYLIEKLGLKGHKIGGAKISEYHANFVENVDQAKAEDVKKIIEKIRTEVKSKYGIDLELEIDDKS